MATCYLDKYESDMFVNQTLNKGMIGSLFYLTPSRPNIMQSI